MPAVRKSPAIILFWKIHPWLYRVTGGLLGGRIGGMPALLLTTVGRKSGGVASQVKTMRAREAQGEERSALWDRAVAADASYAEYLKRTTRTPVVVLEPA